MSVTLNIIIGITIPIILLFFVVDKKAKIPVGFLIIGMFICCIAESMNGLLDIAYNLTPIELTRYVAPVVEETIKAVPIILFFLIRKPDIKTAFMAAVATGVGFATIENIFYFINNNVSNIAFVLTRGLSTGIMHVMTLVIVTLVLYRVIKLGAMRYIIVLISVLAFSITFHGLYNLLINSTSVVAYYIGFILPPLLAIVFLILLKHEDIAKAFKKIRRKEIQG